MNGPGGPSLLLPLTNPEREKAHGKWRGLGLPGIALADNQEGANPTVRKLDVRLQIDLPNELEARVRLEMAPAGGPGLGTDDEPPHQERVVGWRLGRCRESAGEE